MDAPGLRANAQVWTGRIMSGLFVAFMLMDMSMKLMRMPQVEDYGRQLGLPAGSGFGIGVGELFITALYLYPRTSVLGAVLVAAFMGGTVAVHWTHGDPLFSHVLFGVYLALLAWGGLWLREPRLRALLPMGTAEFRRK
ncbi:DoxX family protein [Phenylobacterium soli]|uniref:DoxX family protein n=2 Tax=Phenylobacterium soli TaxID=2170551 RepID=A0A328AAL8_9CAUL|nr:DoxX family protein [Phenylobacterium soli]